MALIMKKKPIHLLIADDYNFSGRVFPIGLNHSIFPVFFMKLQSGLDALEVLSATPFDDVLLDIQMRFLKN